MRLLAQKRPLQMLVVFAAYFVAGKLGLSVPFTNWNVSPVWPPAGVGLAALLICGLEIWPAVALAALCVNFFSPVPHLAAFGIAMGNTLGALMSAYLLQRIPGFTRSLLSLRDVLLFAVVAPLGPTVAASIGSASLYLNGIHAWNHFSASWLMWWAGDTVGVLVFAPLIMSAARVRAEHRMATRLAEALLLLAGVLAICRIAFDDRLVSKPAGYLLAFSLFPFVMWAAIRFSVFGTSLVSSALALVAVWRTSAGHGPFVQYTPLENAALLQTFLALISLTGMVLASVVYERERAKDALLLEQQLLREREQAEAERLLTQQALLRSEKLAVAGRFAATIAHEINNPLSAITNLVFLLGRESLPEATRKLVTVLASEVRRVSEIARQTISLYRETASPIRVKLADVIEEIVTLYSPRLNQQAMSIEKNFSAAAEIEAYPVEMHQVFANLLLNAMEAAGEGGHISIDVSETADDRSCVVIRDDGPGIPEGIRTKIFEPFFSTKTGRGLGLGLWVTRGIVERHGGEILVSSETGANHSTEFTVLLPKAFGAPARPKWANHVAS